MINEKYITLFKDHKEAVKLTKKILKDGYLALPDFFKEDSFKTLHDYSYPITYEDNPKILWKKDTPAMEIARHPEVIGILDAIHKARCNIEGTIYKLLDPEKTAISLPIKNNSKHPLAGDSPFHYDDSYINCVLPIVMPNNTKEGNLYV